MLEKQNRHAVTTTNPPNRSPEKIGQMFDKISARYDLLNHLLSFGADFHWRKKLIRFLPQKKKIRLLDLATGTADQLMAIVKKSKQVTNALGIDLSEEMIRIGQRKIFDKPYASRITLMKGDATDISLQDESVDCVTLSFGVRNFDSVEKGLSECLRVLTPYGRLLILEFSLPKNRMIKGCHLFYLRHILPHIGGWISRNKEAYRYLNQTIETFPSGNAFCDVMKKAGFVRVKAYPLTMGVVTLYVGEKVGCQTEL